jgi:hypothetical protein
MNEQLFQEIYDKAMEDFKRSQGGVRGQQLTVTDDPTYWVITEAYRRGHKQGRLDGFSDGYKEGSGW